MQKRLALVGVGSWGANFLRTIMESEQDVAALVISSKTKQQLNDIAVNDAVIIPDISRFDECNVQIDGAVIATHPELQPEIIRTFLSKGIPVLAEKPLSLDFRISCELIDLSRTLNIRLLEDFIYLFSWPYRVICDQLTSSFPIDIVSSGGNWGPFRSYSPVYDYLPHDLAMTLQIFKRMPEEVRMAIREFREKNAYSADIQLHFGELGTARISISNISTNRVRKLEVHQDDKVWLYDDTRTGKLTYCGMTLGSSCSDRTPMQLLLDNFCGREVFYRDDEMQWLSRSVAGILQQLEPYTAIKR